MSRIKISFPSLYLYKCIIPVNITDINYGNHLGNDVFLKFAHEARVRFLCSLKINETNVGDNQTGLIMSNAAISYKSQVLYPESLVFYITIDNISTYSFDVKYLLKKLSDDSEASRIQTTMIAYNYGDQKIAKLPDIFMNKINQLQDNGIKL